MAEPDGVQPGESVAAAGAAEEDRELVADQFAAAIGEDGWPIGQARPVLLAAVGREPSDQAALRGDGRKNRRLAGADGVNGGGVWRKSTEKEERDGGVSMELGGKMGFAGIGVLRQVESGTLVQPNAARAEKRQLAKRQLAKKATRSVAPL